MSLSCQVVESRASFYIIEQHCVAMTNLIQMTTLFMHSKTIVVPEEDKKDSPDLLISLKYSFPGNNRPHNCATKYFHYIETTYYRI